MTEQPEKGRLEAEAAKDQSEGPEAKVVEGEIMPPEPAPVFGDEEPEPSPQIGRAHV